MVVGRVGDIRFDNVQFAAWVGNAALAMIQHDEAVLRTGVPQRYELEQREAHRAETDATVTGAEETGAEAGAAARGQTGAEEKGAVGG